MFATILLENSPKLASSTWIDSLSFLIHFLYITNVINNIARVPKETVNPTIKGIFCIFCSFSYYFIYPPFTITEEDEICIPPTNIPDLTPELKELYWVVEEAELEGYVTVAIPET